MARTAGVAGFILAAGEGRRLRPVTLSRPKAMVPFCGVPLLELAAAHVASARVSAIAVNAGYLAPAVESFRGPLAERVGREIRVSREERLLDTGGGLRRGAPLLPEARHILVHNADVVLDCDLNDLVERHLSGGAAATAYLVPGTGPLTVDLAADGRVADFRRPPGTGAFTFAGVHILRREVLDFVPEDEPFSIIAAYERAMAAGLPVAGVPTGDAWWSDLGRPSEYIRAHGTIADAGIRHLPRLRDAQAEQARRRAELERSGVRCTGALGIGRPVSVAPGAHVHNAVVWDGAVLADPFLYADAVFTGAMASAPPVDEDRRPDPRVFFSLGAAPAEVAVTPLRKQGSGRRYSRLAAGGRRWVWCVYSHARRENAAFAALSDFLAGLGINVPEVIVHLGDAGEIVARDLGDRDLQRIDDPAETERILAGVVRQIARLHVLGDRAARLQELPLQNGFTKGLYDWERDYFREYILVRLLGAPDLWTPAAREYGALRTRLLAESPVPIHRDLQSANIMVAGGEPFLIDFQGMRPGCAAYDLGSLLYDPYREHPAERRERFWRLYREEVAALGGTPPADDVFHVASVQRLLQVLGAYGKLWMEDGLEWYRRFIMPGLRLLGEAATAGGRPEIARVAAAASRLAETKGIGNRKERA